MSARSIAHASDHRRWTPAVPLSGGVAGRVFLGVFGALVGGAAVAIWSVLTHSGLTSDQITGFAILATAVRETLDASSMRLTMRILRTNDMSRAERVAAAIIFPAAGGAVAAMLFAPVLLIPLTALTWIVSIVSTCALEQPWKTAMSYEEMRERGRQTRLMTREHFTEEIADGRMTLHPIADEGYYLDEDGNRIEE